MWKQCGSNRICLHTVQPSTYQTHTKQIFTQWRVEAKQKNIFKRKKHRVSELYEGYIGVLMYKLPEYNVFLLFRFKKHDVIDGHIGNAFLGEHLWLITQHVRKTNAIIRGFDEMAE